MKRYVKRVYHSIKALRIMMALGNDRPGFGEVMNNVPSLCSAIDFSSNYADGACRQQTLAVPMSNPLWDYFCNHEQGPGIWKWEHYFEIYHRHLSRFIGKKVNVLEIGVYAGGSLGMWRSYFGAQSHIYGVDIQEACKKYENDYTTILVGDQADREFWRVVRESVGAIDILIDDGGHTTNQMQTTLEEMLPHLRPGGVYVCEDIHGRFNGFAAFATGLVNELNNWNGGQGPDLTCSTSSFQSAIHSIHFYPFVTVIEKHRAPVESLSAPKRGTQWQPFA